MITDQKVAKAAKFARDRIRLGPPVDAVLTTPAITMNAGDHKKLDVSAFSYRLNGSILAVAARTAIAFSAAHVVAIGKWGAILVMVDQSGLISTKIGGATQTATQSYNTEDLALAALPMPDGGKCAIGTITINTNAATWTANTDNLDAADLVAANLLGYRKDRRWNQFLIDGNIQVDDLYTFCRGKANTTNAQVLVTHDNFNGLVTNPSLEVDRRTIANATVTKLRVGPFDYMIDGVLYHTDAQKQIAFSAAHPVTADKWGAILIQINAAGTISTKISGATQTTTQTYTNSASARAALPSPDAGNVAIGVLVVEAKNATWTANTDDIVAGSDLENFDLFPSVTDRALDNVSLAIDAVPEKFKIAAAFNFSIHGVKVNQPVATAKTFSANHTCTASKYLAILVQVDAANAVSTKVPLIDGRSQTSAQGFDSYDLAMAALPQTDADKLAIGAIVILAKGVNWVANTDDMTAGSDCTAAYFVGFTTLQRNNFHGIEATNQNALWPISGAAFTANRNVSATLESGTDPRPPRGFNGGTVGVYFGATTTGTVLYPEAILELRPWPLAGEGVQVAQP